ncbi:MAG TPA: DNA double-strand break repair nuclease NurA [Coleofasciculaceae cyanobacterium]
MLDLTRLAQQMQGMSQQLTVEAAAARHRLEQAQTVLNQVTQRQDQLVQLHQTWGDRLAFTAAQPLEPLNRPVSLSGQVAVHTILATDGSQIAPSHHEIAYCYLINIGRIVLHYGQSRFPLLDSLPEVFYQPDDLYGARQWGIRTEEWMSYRRTVSEATVLAELAEEMGQEDLATDATARPPYLAMVDGSLIYWFLETLPGEARDRILSPILQAWERLRAAQVPLVGYLSASRSREALNFLQLQLCPYETPDCQRHCAGPRDRAPCQVLDPLKDTAIWANLLQPGERSPLWRSSASILNFYGEHRVYFCYLHVGSEIARIEFPAWVAADARQLDQILSQVLTQVQKGYGYPIALAEAHNLAVVRGSDRARFFALLEQHLIRAGLQNVGTSYKEARKRGSIA